MQVLVIKPGETEHKAVDIVEGTQNMLKGLQGLVGGYVEAVHTQQLRMKKNVMLVDEDGISKGKPRNLEAERVSGYAGNIMGTAVICGEYMTDEGMDWNSVNS